MIEGYRARNESDIQLAVKQLFIGVAPERSDELSKLWDEYQLRFNLLPEDGRDGKFVMDAGAYRDVRFNHRALRAFWVSVFAAWEGYRVALGDAIDSSRFRSLLDAVHEILETEDPCEVQLPDGIPAPGVFVEARLDSQARAAAELAVFSAGWALLHEVRHIQHQQAGTSAEIDGALESKHAEEVSCDEFAIRFILERSGDYATQHSVSKELVDQKRQAGVHLALFALTVIARNHWAATKDHPSIQTRIDEVWRGIRRCGMNSEAALIARLAFHSLTEVYVEAPRPPCAD